MLVALARRHDARADRRHVQHGPQTRRPGLPLHDHHGLRPRTARDPAREAAPRQGQGGAPASTLERYAALPDLQRLVVAHEKVATGRRRAPRSSSRDLPLSRDPRRSLGSPATTRSAARAARRGLETLALDRPHAAVFHRSTASSLPAARVVKPRAPAATHRCPDMGVRVHDEPPEHRGALRGEDAMTHTIPLLNAPGARGHRRFGSSARAREVVRCRFGLAELLIRHAAIVERDGHARGETAALRSSG